MSSQTHQEHQQQPTSTTSTTFGGYSADLAAQLAAPVSPTTEKSASEAQRRLSEWKPPTGPQRAFSFDEQEHKRAMMAASGTLSSSGPAGLQAQGFSERS